MAYRNVHETFWTDPKVKKELNPVTKFLYLYFITNPHSHYSGIYYLPLVTVKDETGLTDKQIKDGMDTLSMGYHIRYDTLLEIVWVVKMLKKEKKSITQITGVANHLKTLHNSSLIKDFLKHYEDLQIPHTYPIHTPSMESGYVDVDVDEDVAVDVDEETTSAESDKSPSAPATPKPLKISFSYARGLFENIKQSYLDQWEKAYPAVSVYPEIRKMEAWASANPKNRKSNWQRFIVNWLTKAQDRAGTDKSQPQESSRRHGGRLPDDYDGVTPKKMQSMEEDNGEA